MKSLTTVKVVVFLLCLIPLGRLGWGAYTNNLGPNPIEVITRSTGTWTLVFLLIVLSVSPLRRLSGFHGLIRLRRMLGLFAFFYLCLHFVTYIWLDQFFELAEIAKDVMKRPFITAGFVSFLLLLPLALTSTSGMIRRLGGRRWQQLHRLVYVAAIGGVVHFIWLVKADLREPLIYAGILTVLLGFRVVVSIKDHGSLPLMRRSHSGREAKVVGALKRRVD
ncbi:MAG: sulfoxide reductase heme-binding subunit YedZ [Deltaproteobacteria bacterium]|nr:sulfoxide reductase heme-binding subunit YedZ [Deltaproteobacteria bacterium]